MRQTESVLLNKWLWAKHRKNLQWKRVRLGALPNKEMGKMYNVLLRWADAIVIKEGMVYIIEAKLRPDPKAIGQLEYYKLLFPSTPEFSAFKHWPIKLVLLTATQDLGMVEYCSTKRILFEYFDIGYKPEEADKWKKKFT